jgi:predicted NodU family carbamoyl transferase
MNILGISAYYHDSAAALLRDGDLVAAAQEERFSRKKHDARFPTYATEYCLAEGKVALQEIDYVVFYDKPLVKFDRLLETYHADLAQRKALLEKTPTRRARHDRSLQGQRTSAPDVHRASSGPCGLGFLSKPVRTRSRIVHGWGRGMGHRLGLVG